MAHEYCLFTQGIKVNWEDDPDPAAHAEAIRNLASVWFPMLEANFAMNGETWELLSHDVTPTPTGAVLTVLGRRESR